MTPPASLALTIARLKDASSVLTSDRKARLDVLVNYIQAQLSAEKPIILNFICTHNSRRSHLGQIWGKVAAESYGIDDVTTFSGGTEATAFNPRAIAAIERAGFRVEIPEGSNPKVKIFYDESKTPLICFSKTYDDEFNRAEEFAAVMTCNDADKNCPVIVGATRISLPYLDPKAADDTPEEASRYTERSEQIGAELFYVFDRASQHGVQSGS